MGRWGARQHTSIYSSIVALQALKLSWVCLCCEQMDCFREMQYRSKKFIESIWQLQSSILALSQLTSLSLIRVDNLQQGSFEIPHINCSKRLDKLRQAATCRL